ncbi:hypothetical protein AB0J83_36445 [Actinoplanes sp. NPDC049596]|uniref:hypothetical protein n=1 Tax=unclassified Actinoplanes TaxID=2626549 RepID=UPI0034388E94
MRTIFAYFSSAAPDPPVETAYSQDLAHALTAAAGLIAMLAVIYLVFKATYLFLRLFTHVAFFITLGLFVSVMVIGVLNR